MTQTKTVAVEVDDRNIQRPWDESDLVTDWSAFPRGYGILLNERLIFPEDLCLWRMKIDTTRQLFVDDHLIAHQRDLKREFHSPQDHPANPVLTHRRPDGLSTAWGTYVCPDEEHGYRMYYKGPGGLNYVANSTDGVNWDKPDLGVYDHSAEPERFVGGPNNAISEGTMFGLLRETHDPDPRRQWKLVLMTPRGTRVTWPYRDSPPDTLLLPVPGLGQVHWPRGQAYDDSQPARGTLMQILTSADGLRWTCRKDTALLKGPALFQAPYHHPIGISDMVRIRWDPKLKTYVGNVKYFIGPDLRVTPACHTGRVVAMCESDDLIHWSSPRVYGYPDGEDTKQPGMWGIYEADGFPYESMWLNFLCTAWYHPASREERRKRDLMPTRPFMKRNRIRLAGSRDGRHWYYLGDRRPFLDLGPEGSWKPHNLRMANRDTVGGPLLKDDQLWFYYKGQNIDGFKGTWQQKTGLAILRRDGFASLNAGEETKNRDRDRQEADDSGG